MFIGFELLSIVSDELIGAFLRLKQMTNYEHVTSHGHSFPHIHYDYTFLFSAHTQLRSFFCLYLFSMADWLFNYTASPFPPAFRRSCSCFQLFKFTSSHTHNNAMQSEPHPPNSVHIHVTCINHVVTVLSSTDQLLYININFFMKKK